MSRSSKKIPSYFIVPDEKINYGEFIQLGNILYSVSEPDNLVAKPRLADGPHPLGVEILPPKKLNDYCIKRETEKASRVGFFAKILELLGFGAGISRKSATASTESYTVKTMDISTFRPPAVFLEAVKKDQNVNDVLRNTQERYVFLITGVVVATGVEFNTYDSKERNSEGSIGINGHVVTLGPSGSKSRKTVLDISYADAGPVTLAFRVQKLQLREDGSMSSEPHVDGAYFGNDEKKYVVDVDADLDDFDVEGMEVIPVIHEISGEEYNLYATQ